MPFLENVTRGRGIPRERLLDVAEHYHHFGGVSPINEQNKALIAAVEKDLAAAGVQLPVYWGNRNWAPYVEDTWAQMADDGIEHVYVFPTSAYASFSGCRQYHEDIARARPCTVAARRRRSCRTTSTPRASCRPTPTRWPRPWPRCPRTRATAPAWSRRHTASRIRWPTSPDPTAGPTRPSCGPPPSGSSPRSPPVRPFDLVWQSRSGPPSVPWLEPDVNDHLRALAEDGATAVVLFPVGFISDHLEVIWDLDNEARETAAELGLTFARAATAGTHPDFVRTVRELLEERRAGGLPRLGTDCPASCCYVRRP